MGDRDKLQELLDKIVETDNGIDAVFVCDLKEGFALENSSTEKGRAPDLVNTLKNSEVLTNMSVFQTVKRNMDEVGKQTQHGEFKSTFLRLDKGIFVLYVYLAGNMPIGIGFVNTTQPNDSLARMVFFCEKNVDDVWSLVESLYGK